MQIKETYWYRLISTPKPFTLSQRAYFVAALVLLVAFLNWLAPGHPNLTLRSLSSIMLVVATYPAWRWMSGRDRGLPFMALLPLVYSLYFAVPVFLLERFSWNFGPPIPQSWLIRAQWLSLLCLVLIEFGYYASSSFLDRMMPHVRMEWTNLEFVKFASIVLGLIGLFVYLVGLRLQIEGGAQQIVVLIGDLSLISTTTLFVLQLTTGLDSLTKVFLWFVLIPSRMLLSLAAGATSYAFATPLLLIFLYSSVRRRLPWGYLALGIALIFIIRPIVTPLRQLTWKGGPLAGASAGTKLKIGAGLAKKEIGGQVPYETLLQFMAQRLGEIESFAIIAHQTPGVIPYWHGGSYKTLPYKFVPRFLDPNKPSDANFDFPHRYGLTSRTDYITLIGDPLPEEIYANFGLWGIIWLSALLGVIYRAVHATFVHTSMGIGALVSGVYLLTQFFRIEWQQAMILGGVLYAFPVLVLVNFIISAGDLRCDAPNALTDPYGGAYERMPRR